MKMNESDYNSNELSDITTLNYAMLKPPTKLHCQKRCTNKRIMFRIIRNMNRYVWSLDNKVVSENR